MEKKNEKSKERQPELAGQDGMRGAEGAIQDGETRGAEPANQDGIRRAEPANQDAGTAVDATIGTGAPALPAGKHRGLVGARSIANAVVAWCLEDGLNVVVMARPLCKERAWSLECRSAGQLKMSGVICGGRMTAQAIARKVRDGMVRRIMKRKRDAERRKQRQAELHPKAEEK